MPFPSFDSDFLVSYDAYWSTYRLFVRNGFRDDLLGHVARCEASGYNVANFSFAVREEDATQVEFPAVEIGYQRSVFFEDSEAKTWEGNEHRRVAIPDGAAIVEAANQYIFVKELAESLQEIRDDLEWMPVLTSDKYDREFFRLVPRPEHSFLSPATVIGERWALLWVAGSAEPPDDLFCDRIAIGPESAFYPLIARRGVALDLKRKFPSVPFTPILECNSEMGKVVVRVCELLKSRIKPVDWV